MSDKLVMQNLQLQTQLLQAARQQRALINQQLTATFDVTDQQAAVLEFVQDHPGRMQKDVAEMLHRRAATVSSLLKRLETGNYLIRKIPVDNTRQKVLLITEQGRAVVAAFKQSRQVAANKMGSQLTDDEQQLFLSLLQKLTND
ncbi:MarR family winged helix-turn-helix transcriptional regulator [Furfurilactobacillus curtus]|uniref:HTH marR-type domain-containing protein n=1 Tax=Furfurilactobacillus curtus TaxID=1746200 RepID=A0ABQ5JPA7_9LACO